RPHRRVIGAEVDAAAERRRVPRTSAQHPTEPAARQDVDYAYEEVTPMRVPIAFALLALAACSSAPPRADSDLSFTGADLNAPVAGDSSPCPEAAFPGGSSLDSQGHDAGTFFCEH